jgi:hypothetical protein
MWEWHRYLKLAFCIVACNAVFAAVAIGSADAEAPPAVEASQSTAPVYEYVTTAQQLQSVPSAQIAGVTPQATEVKPAACFPF